MNVISRYLLPLSASFLLAGTAVGEVVLQPYYSLSIGSYPEAVAIADLNSDGRNDVVLNTSTNSDPENDFKLKVFLQDSFGQLQAPTNYPLNGEDAVRPQSLAVGDLNGDGLQDVAVGVDRSHIEIFLQYTDGTMFRSDTITTPLSTRVAVDDLNGDGLDDIAGIALGGDEVGIFLQGEDGIGHQPESHYAPQDGFGDMVLGDINGDGASDIVIVSRQTSADKLIVVPSGGRDGLGPMMFYYLGGNELTKGVTIGDMNGDGKKDVAVSFGGNRPLSSIAVFHQGDTGLLNAPEVLASYDNPGTIYAADLNMDSREDLMVLHGDWHAMGVYEQYQEETLADEVLFNMPYASRHNPQGMDVGDINGDGTPDVVVTDYNHGLVVLLGVAEPREAPVANAGSDQVVNGNALVLLDGSLSADIDGNIVDYRWTQLSGAAVSLNDSGNGNAVFAAPAAISGENQYLEFQLEVEDNDGLTGAETVTVTVLGNLAPIADAGEDQTVDSGTSVVLDGSQSRDTNGTIVGYRWSQVSGTPVELENLPGGAAVFLAPVFNSPVKELLEFELEVEDEGGVRSIDRVYVIVEGPKNPVANAGENQTVNAGVRVVLDGSQSWDSDGSIVSYRWREVFGTSLEITSFPDGTASFIAPTIPDGTKALLMLELEVEDNEGRTAKDSMTVTVESNMLLSTGDMTSHESARSMGGHKSRAMLTSS